MRGSGPRTGSKAPTNMYMFRYRNYARGMAIDVHPVSALRSDLSTHLKAFRLAPDTAEPVVLGAQRKAEAVLLPISQYRALLQRVEELSVRAEVADVMARDTGGRRTAADVARELGFDPTEFGLA